jgi:hypothetical protein
MIKIGACCPTGQVALRRYGNLAKKPARTKPLTSPQGRRRCGRMDRPIAATSAAHSERSFIGGPIRIADDATHFSRLYPAQCRTRNFPGEMIRKLSVTSSQ